MNNSDQIFIAFLRILALVAGLALMYYSVTR